MALTKGVNTYATLAEAGDYFVTRLDAAAWSSASPEQQEAALVTATNMLDTLVFNGRTSGASQPLMWPRTLRYLNPYSNRFEEVVPTEIPRRLTVATLEMAHHLLNNDGLTDDTGRVSKVVIGELEVDGLSQPALFPKVVMDNISLFLKPGSTSLKWWRAN